MNFFFKYVVLIQLISRGDFSAEIRCHSSKADVGLSGKKSE